MLRLSVYRMRRVVCLTDHLKIANVLRSCTVASNMENTNGKPSVGIIIIGDEILKGQTQDTNSHFLTRRLYSLGVRVRKISVIPDDVTTIAAEVKEFSSKFTHVITSGGIGPTHDDVTFEGVALAFEESVFPHPDLVALCKKFFGTDDLKSPKLKLAFIPQSASLKYGVDSVTGEKSRYPLVVVRNVHIFPGVPSLMETAFQRLEDLFRNPDAGFCVRQVYLNADEVSITNVLNEVNDQFKDRVVIGSYPDMHNSYYKVKLTFESAAESNIDAVLDVLHSKLSNAIFVNFDPNPVGNAVERVFKLASGSDEFSMKLKHALHVVNEAFERYSVDEICTGFNGGKDCTALLHLVFTVACQKKLEGSLSALYIRRGQPFPEVEQFIQKTISRYHLKLLAVDGRIRDALFELKSTQPRIGAVLMGTRRSDPHSEILEDFSPTDPDWPEYMRVNPLLNWSYVDVWRFLRELSLPYCSLYDHGYTSLGSLENTHPNPQLRDIDSRGIASYRPAYTLKDCDSERAGRN